MIMKPGDLSAVPVSDYAMFSFHGTVSFFIGMIVISLVIVIAGLFSLVRFKKDYTTSFTNRPSGRYFWYLAIYVLVDLILSFIISSIYPSYGITSINRLPNFVQVYYYLVSVPGETLFFSIIPISVILLIYGFASKKISVIIKSGDLSWNIVGAISIGVATYAAILYVVLGQNIYYVVSAYVTTLMVSIIYLKFGLIRAILTNFIMSMISFLSVLVSKIPAYSLLLTIFLFAWASVGIYYLFLENESRQKRISQERMDREKTRAAQEARREVQAPLLKPEDLFIRSSCPECGGIVFHVRGDMNLECDHCHHVVSPDDVGPFNIKIDIYGRIHDHYSGGDMYGN
ncbi:hypothetical membrane protein [Thermoplasma acidophilum]|uniref:Hypothetical membrane protein n=2 Tax=Thermoplasma acidophilum TaxID=2303 RepID=Q9HKU6_THEAC|nr:hypothetical membrane protein [Thermoplasma acidophilum]